MAVKWTEKQREVIDSRNRNLLVSAAAGSGKTAVLVERIIQMISEGDHPLDIDQLLVMTFTNAAAAEMRERIGAAVEKKLKERPQDEHLWLQAALIPQAQITTIDSFCLSVIRNHYNRLDIDPAFRMGDEGELSLLRGDCMGEMLEACYEEDRPEFARFVEHFGRGRSDKGIEDVILQAWQFSQSHPWPGEWLDSCIRELDEENLGQMEKSAWFQFLTEDISCQMRELAGQLETALEVCREENGPLAYEPMLERDLSGVRAIGAAAGSGSFEQLYELLISMTFDRLASIRSKEIDGEKKAFVSAVRDRVKKAVAKCRELYGQQSPKEAENAMTGVAPVIRELLHLTGLFDEVYRRAKRERNVLDFNDLEHLALEVLYEKEDGEEQGKQQGKQQETGTVSHGPIRRPSEVAKELSCQFEEILVDEYQDSNYVQEALITSISRERLGTPNVFMVGDVKQSIYRFRLARPELFMEKYGTYSREPSDYQMIELRQNFRSRDTVLEGINDVFYQIMTKNLGGIDYTSETALYPGAVFPKGEDTLQPEAGEQPEAEDQPKACLPGVSELLLADTGSQSFKQLDEDSMDYTAKELEARLIARRIRQLTDEKQGLMIWDKEKESCRRARYADVVILLRSMTGWSEIFVNELMNEGIPAFAQTSTGYFNTVEVETIPSLLSVIDNPIQDIPLAAVMRSPIGGMDDEEMAWLMAAYKKNGKKGQDRGVYGAWRLWLEEGEEALRRAEIPLEAARSIFSKVQALDQLIGELRLQARYLPIHQLLYEVYRVSGYYDYVSAMPAGETRRANLDMLAEKAAAYESTSYKGLFHFVRYIEKLRKFDTDFGEASVAGEQDAAVRIMSIHKSKGLEFPVVFLAGMGKRFNKQDAYSSILLDADLGAATDFVDLDLRVKSPTLKKQALKRKSELETMGEELRILYVAMTRAKEKLIMTGTDRSLAQKIDKWRDLPRVGRQLPYTVLSSANSYLDWVLMAAPGISPNYFCLQEVPVRELVGEEVTRQINRKMKREDLLGLEPKVYDPFFKEELEKALGYFYPYQADTDLYTMLSVSELKKRSQAEKEEELVSSGYISFSGIVLPEAEAEPEARIDSGLTDERKRMPKRKGQSGAFRGNAYHTVLEHLPFHQIHNLEETKEAVDGIWKAGFLDEESRQMVNSGVIWKFLSSPLGKRLADAQKRGVLHREQQFIIGVPARDMDLGDSDELVLVQGVIDVYFEDGDGLVLLDYKTDRVDRERPKESGEKLAKRYKIQMDYYEKALFQLTGRPVKERIIYSLGLQKAILL